MESSKNDTGNLFTKQKLKDFENKLTVTRGETVWERKLRVWNQSIPTAMYKIDHQQEPTLEHRELNTL